jgi:uncharacterized protein
MIKVHAFRLHPGNDLKREIDAFVVANQIRAGWISCGVGSLTGYNIRFANQSEGSKGAGHFEMVSLMGTVSLNGSHIHISISDSTGQTIGGHLLEENFIYTTAEIIIQEADNLAFSREYHKETGWKELEVKRIE